MAEKSVVTTFVRKSTKEIATQRVEAGSVRITVVKKAKVDAKTLPQLINIHETTLLKIKLHRLTEKLSKHETKLSEVNSQLEEEKKTNQRLSRSIDFRDKEISRLNSNLEQINENIKDKPIPKSARSPGKSYFENAIGRGSNMDSRPYQGGLPSLGKRR